MSEPRAVVWHDRCPACHHEAAIYWIDYGGSMNWFCPSCKGGGGRAPLTAPDGTLTLEAGGNPSLPEPPRG